MTSDGSRITDVIVLGSGPAGCAAASICAQAGLNVLIVTDESEQIDIPSSSPVPLESIHPGVSSLLEKIGTAGAEQEASRSLYSGIYAGSVYTPLGEDKNGKWQGMHINRQIFNARLVHRIQELGIAVIFNEKVEDIIFEKAESRELGAESRSSQGDDPAILKNAGGREGKKIIGIKTSSKELCAKYIIDASGKNGIAGKKLNFKRKFFSPPFACWTGISSIDQTFSFDPYTAHFIPVPGGWTWLAPQPPDYCAWTRLSILRSPKYETLAKHEGESEKSLLPPDELKAYSTIGKVHFANMRWRLFRPVCSEGVVLCGDAAGILDPAAGQGIFNALLSGITAANTVISCIKQPDSAGFQLAYYDDWFVRQFEEKVVRLKSYYKEHAINIFDD